MLAYALSHTRAQDGVHTLPPHPDDLRWGGGSLVEVGEGGESEVVEAGLRVLQRPTLSGVVPGGTAGEARCGGVDVVWRLHRDEDLADPGAQTQTEGGEAPEAEEPPPVCGGGVDHCGCAWVESAVGQAADRRDLVEGEGGGCGRHVVVLTVVVVAAAEAGALESGGSFGDLVAVAEEGGREIGASAGGAGCGVGCRCHGFILSYPCSFVKAAA
jgi:hypothetical protein